MDSEEMRFERDMGWPWLCMISGMPKSTIHLRDMEFMKLKI